MENNQNKDPKKPAAGETKPKGNYLVSIIATLVLTLLIVWVYNAITDGKYEKPPTPIFCPHSKTNNWQKWRSNLTASST